MDNDYDLFEDNNAFRDEDGKEENPAVNKQEKEKRLNIARTIYKVFRGDIESVTDIETGEVIYRNGKEE